MSNTAEKNLERLKQGYLFWNQYRSSEESLEKNLDFDNLDIEGAYWRFNELKNADLDNCTFRNTHFRNLDFLGIDFSKSEFTSASFNNVHFSKCNFSDSIFKDTKFHDTRWYHSDLSKARSLDLSQFENIHFYKCTFKKNGLENLDLPEEIFEECRFD